MNLILWQPTPEQRRNTNLARFRPFDSYADLHRWSVEHAAEFWQHVWDFSGAIGTFNGTLNFAENLLRDGPDPAIIFRNERGERRTLSRNELRRKSLAFAHWLHAHGVKPGDRVAAILPNVPEAIIAMLGTAAVGAIWSSCSPDFGADAILDRFQQIEPKVLISCGRETYGGKVTDVAAKLDAITPRLPSVTHTLLLGEAFDAACAGDAPFRFERFPFNHPLAILYSSGTTGAPKCIVHGAGGTLIQHLKEHQLHCDLQPGDVLFYYTTTGWMMWNWLVSALASGVTIVLFDGSPLTPSIEVLWKLASEEKVTHFGASARYYAAVQKTAYEPQGIDTLRMILSTGSPLLPETFDYLYERVKSDVCVASISGGTDIISCFALGCPTEPVRRGELQVKGLGMDVAVVDDTGKPIVGTPGELVCRNTFPCMPVMFWNDPDGKKYKAAYFERFDGIWCHGDWAEETPNGGIIIYGRSDATLNPGGVRIGTAEIYNQVEAFPQVAESLATAYRREGDEKIVLFLRMKDGESFTPELVSAIKQRLREKCSPRHVPSFVFEAKDFPRTISGKLSEIAVRNALHGEEIRNLAALANPESLEAFRNVFRS